MSYRPADSQYLPRDTDEGKDVEGMCFFLDPKSTKYRYQISTRVSKDMQILICKAAQNTLLLHLLSSVTPGNLQRVKVHPVQDMSDVNYW